MSKPVEVTLFIELDRIDSFVMDIRDASLNLKDKDDFHKILADSIEDQAQLHKEKECDCGGGCGCNRGYINLYDTGFIP